MPDSGAGIVRRAVTAWLGGDMAGVPLAAVAVAAGLGAGLLAGGRIGVLVAGAVLLAAANGYSKAYSP